MNSGRSYRVPLCRHRCRNILLFRSRLNYWAERWIYCEGEWVLCVWVGVAWCSADLICFYTVLLLSLYLLMLCCLLCSHAFTSDWAKFRPRETNKVTANLDLVPNMRLVDILFFLCLLTGSQTVHRSWSGRLWTVKNKIEPLKKKNRQVVGWTSL